MADIAHLQKMRNRVVNGETHARAYRRDLLIRFRESLLKHEEAIYKALEQDLRKGREETWATEIGLVVAELNEAIGSLRKWMSPRRVRTNLLNWPSSCHIHAEPLGLVLIIAPWNYPVQLLFNPMVGALAAGNTVVLKPSEFTPATEEVMRAIVAEAFSTEEVLYITGDGAQVVPELMQSFTFDHVFYTGSTSVGRLVYKMAADKLVPVTLELGGKSPTVIEPDADLRVSARRIAMIKFSNCGQMCVAPDFILVHESIRDAFLDEMKKAIWAFYGTEPQQSESFGRIVNTRQFDRLLNYLADGEILIGGRHDRSDLFIEPTLLSVGSLDSPIMNEEIFGPLLPILTYENFEEARAIIERHPNPLAFYVFTQSKSKADRWLDAVPAGGACVNNASWHLSNTRLPFGGRGNSGIGAYHGRQSFDTFSHHKSVMRTPTWFDPAIKYPPFAGKLNLFKKMVR
ncbi:MAG: aldehyde dehydrogenase family protein [Bacteroidota bacterium]